MSENVQYILTLVVVAGAVVYTLYTVIGLFKKSKGDGCTSHGCPSCGIKNELKSSYAKKHHRDEIKFHNSQITR